MLSTILTLMLISILLLGAWVLYNKCKEVAGEDDAAQVAQTQPEPTNLNDALYDLNLMVYTKEFNEKDVNTINGIIDDIMSIDKSGDIVSGEAKHVFDRIARTDLMRVVTNYSNLNDSSRADSQEQFAESLNKIGGFMTSLQEHINNGNVSEFDVSARIVDMGV